MWDSVRKPWETASGRAGDPPGPSPGPRARGPVGAGEATPIGYASTIEDLELGLCRIKININRKGEHIYHMPGQQASSVARINPGAGERWFYSKVEARAGT